MTRMTKAHSAAKDKWIRTWASPRRLLIAAAIFHSVVTMSIYVLGRNAVLPGMFNSYGIAVSFTPDGIKLQREAARLSDSLVQGQIRDWVNAVSPFHIKLYSICFALLGRWFGPTLLSAELINGLSYLAILVLIFKLGQETFSRCAGLIAATTVALWPSFLLHTTQLLKDPLFLVGMLAFILVNLRLLSRSFSWPQALLSGACGGLIAVFIWLVRDSMGEFPIATASLGALMLVLRCFGAKHFQGGPPGRSPQRQEAAGSANAQTGWGARAANLAGMALLIVMSVAVTRVIPEFRKPEAPQGGLEMTEQVSPGLVKNAALEASEAPPPNQWSRIVRRVG